jgi:hypothetical protein
MVLGEGDDLAVEGRNPARIRAFREDLVDLRAVVRLVADEEQRCREQVGDAVVVDADQLEAYVLEVRQRERPESESLLIGVDRGGGGGEDLDAPEGRAALVRCRQRLVGAHPLARHDEGLLDEHRLGVGEPFRYEELAPRHRDLGGSEAIGVEVAALDDDDRLVASHGRPVSPGLEGDARRQDVPLRREVEPGAERCEL